MTVAVVGASGLTGSAFCDIAADKLPRLRLIGKSTVGTRVTLAGKTYVVEGEEALDKSCEYAMFFTDEQTSRRLVPKAALNGAVCIDNSCAFRMHRDVPLVVPKVNGGDVGRCKVIANPNCTAIQIAIALNCIKSLGIEEVTAVTFQAASGAGREGLADLRQNRGYGKLKAFAHPLCDNVIGQIGELLPDGTTTEEQKLRLELPKEQFREWIYLQAAGPEHIVYETDEATGKRLAMADLMADKRISEWLDERFWLFDLEKNTKHDPETILKQFEYAKMRYNADVFLVDNIMSVDFDGFPDRDFNRVQSRFTQMLVTFSKRRQVHTHLVVHPRKSTSDTNSKVSSDDVSGSGDITNRADNVFFLTTHAVSDKEGQPAQKPLLQILKNRDFGARGQQWLDFDRKSRRFFQDKSGDPKRPYGWDMAAQQIRLATPEDRDDINQVFPE